MREQAREKERAGERERERESGRETGVGELEAVVCVCVCVRARACAILMRYGCDMCTTCMYSPICIYDISVLLTKPICHELTYLHK